MTRFGPYRDAAWPEKSSAAPVVSGDGDLAVVFGILWVGSLLRVGVALANHEMFGAEASVASAVIVILTAFFAGRVLERFRQDGRVS